MDHRAIRRIAQNQHGLVTRQQALEAAATRHSIQAMISSGQWDRMHPGVYTAGMVEPTWTGRVLGAALAAGPDAYASHRTSARLHGLVDRVGRLELLTDGYRRVRLPGVLVHRTIHLTPDDTTIVDGVPTTSLMRTLIDLAARQPEATLGGWIDRSILRGELDVPALVRRTTELTMPGRSSTTALMRALTLRSDGHDPGRSVLEARVIAAAARRGLPALVRQHAVERPDGRKAFIDLAHVPSMVAIELDGWATHGVRAAFEPDRIRSNELLLLGWHVLRFTWFMDDEYICRTILQAIERNSAGQPIPRSNSLSGH